ncbi:hypothetical protein CLIB1423_09S04874 [[Candida] railenensis]|uniref:Monopolin complex subunit Csm1/Pcs1 C-terminal domain-containing protein n=1 Tax=[Candida] railenensis TaxID=45579 RepID=A0A9P0QPP7_9ASCO|nr:hypothetical protein CLIB1423_09S04874 [[Candida] railenensis]
MARTRKAKVEPKAPVAKRAAGAIAPATPIIPPSAALVSSKTVITEKDIFNASSSTQELVSLINTLTSTSQDKLFDDYRAKTQMQLDESYRIIEELNQEIAAKNEIIERLKVSSSKSALNLDQTPSKQPQSSQNLYKSPIRRKKTTDVADLITQDQLSKELDTIGITLDMLELLTGLRITNYEEDDNKFYFDISQSSTAESSDEKKKKNGASAPPAPASGNSLTIVYRLVIAKEFDSTAEINYVPTFLKEGSDDDHIERLKDILPEYFCDNLSFPYNTLSQFYTKINRALNKGVKA